VTDGFVPNRCAREGRESGQNPNIRGMEHEQIAIGQQFL
jgi:hypothetical protein